MQGCMPGSVSILGDATVLFVFGGSSNSRRTSAVEDATPARTASVDLDHGCKDNA